MIVVKFFYLKMIARRCSGSVSSPVYTAPEEEQILWTVEELSGNKKADVSTNYRITVSNDSDTDFRGVLELRVGMTANHPKFFMPGYLYNRNTADMEWGEAGNEVRPRKEFPRIKLGATERPESEFFMTRADRLAAPVSLIYDDGRVIGISGKPWTFEKDDDAETGSSPVCFNGFSCHISDPFLTDCASESADRFSQKADTSEATTFASVGYTIGYENAPWLFVQTAKVLPREELNEKNTVFIRKGAQISFEITIYDYQGEDERAIYRAIEDTYERFHESPRTIDGMTKEKAAALLSGAIRDFAWLQDEHIYTGFVYDRNPYSYNRIPSISWTNGMAVALPMLLTANLLHDETARAQALDFIETSVKNAVNPKTGFFFESEEDGVRTARGWWYNGMLKGGHSSYINGQAVYYLLTAYESEYKNHTESSTNPRTNTDTNSITDCHDSWLLLAGRMVARMNETMDQYGEYPFALSETTGEGIEYDSMSGAWFLAASALYEKITGNRTYLRPLLYSEKHYFEKFVKKAECYGGPLDTDKAPDNEGILAFIRAARILHEITGEDYLLDHLRDALSYEFSYKLIYNTPVQVRPLSEIGWSSSGGSITSVANPHIHPMSATVIPEMRYFLSKRADAYVESRMNDTLGWCLQTFNTRDKEYGFGRIGWMSERFCFCEGLLTEHFPDGEVASTWFALMPWAVGSILEGLTRE